MKKTIYYIFLLLCFGALSCQKEKPVDIIPSREVIQFSSRIAETKGAPLLRNLEDLSTQDFSVNAWYSPEGETFGSNSRLYISNHRFGRMNNSTVWQGISRDGEEKKHDPVYYPLDGSLSFFCYAPYSEINNENSPIQIVNQPNPSITNQWDNYLPGSPLVIYTPAEEVESQFDFIVANPVLDWKKGDGVVSLSFDNHLTSRLEFYCNYSGHINDEEKIYITGIQIENVIGSEYLYFTKEGDKFGYEWCSDISPDGTENMPLVSYLLSNNDRSDSDRYLVEGDNMNLPEAVPDDYSIVNYRYVNNLASGLMYVLPQTFDQYTSDQDAPKLHVTYQIRNGQREMIEESVLSYSLKGSKTWEAGKRIQFKITLNIAERKELNVTTVVINDWEDAGNWPSDREPEEILY